MLRLSVGMRLVLIALGLALGYLLLGMIALLPVRDTGLASPVWPAAGLAFALVFQYGWRVAPGVVLGSFLVNVPAVASNDALSVAVAVGVAIAAGAAAQAIVGAALVRRAVGRTPSLSEPRQILTFLLLAGPVACLVNPTIGLIAQLAGGVIAPEQALMTWLTWWVGDSIGVIVFAPLVLMLLPEQRQMWVGRRAAVAIPSIIVLSVCSWVFVSTAQAELDATMADANAAVQEAATTLELDLQRHGEAVQGIGAFVESSDYVSRSEFRSYTSGILAREPSLQALSWNPMVTQEQRAGFERDQREREGFVGYRVTERDASGAAVPVAPRDRYVVVGYIEPEALNDAALGFDILSSPVRAAAVEAAIETGDLRATAPVDLVIGQGGSGRGVLLLAPVFGDDVSRPTNAEARQQAVDGVAVGVYLVQDLLDHALSAPQWDGLGFTLTDVTDSADPQRMAGIPMAGSPSPIPPLTTEFTVAGRTWALVLTVPRESGLWAQPTTSPAILLGGLVIILLLEAFLLLLTGNERQARREAEVHGYQANHDPLTDLYNRRAFPAMLEKSRERAEEEASRHVLLFMDLDGFKAVNDTSGHEAGDDMLRGVARVLRTHMRERDVVARIGGDEFAAILNNCPEDRGRRIAETLVTSVDEFRLADRPEAPGVGLSVGLAMIDGATPVSIDELMRRADDACYRAKRAGGHTLRAYSEESAADTGTGD